MWKWLTILLGIQWIWGKELPGWEWIGNFHSDNRTIFQRVQLDHKFGQYQTKKALHILLRSSLQVGPSSTYILHIMEMTIFTYSPTKQMTQCVFLPPSRAPLNNLILLIGHCPAICCHNCPQHFAKGWHWFRLLWHTFHCSRSWRCHLVNHLWDNQVEALPKK